MKGIGLLLVILSLVLMYFHLNIRNPYMYGGVGTVFVFNKLVPKLFILWVLIGMSILFYFTQGQISYKLLLFIGMFSIGLVMTVIESQN